MYVHIYLHTHTHTHTHSSMSQRLTLSLILSWSLQTAYWNQADEMRRDEKGRGGEREDRREWKGREEKEERRGEKEHHKSQWNRPCVRSKLCGENEEVSTKIPSRNDSSAPLPAATWERGPGFQSFQFLHRSQESSCTISYMLT